MINYVDYHLLMSQKYILPPLTSQGRKTLNSMLLLRNNKLLKNHILEKKKKPRG